VASANGDRSVNRRPLRALPGAKRGHDHDDLRPEALSPRRISPKAFHREQACPATARRGRRGEICQQDRLFLSVVETRTLGRPLHPNPRKSNPAPQQPPARRKPTNPARHAATQRSGWERTGIVLQGARPHQARCHPGRAHRRAFLWWSWGGGGSRTAYVFSKASYGTGHAERARGRHSGGA